MRALDPKAKFLVLGILGQTPRASMLTWLQFHAGFMILLLDELHILWLPGRVRHNHSHTLERVFLFRHQLRHRIRLR